LLDASDAPCPRCVHPLEVAKEENDPRMHECGRCGGLFVTRDMLAEILCRAEVSGPLRPSKVEGARLDEVRYLACPLCHTRLNRVNFGKVSGIIVDVCASHGTWFDAGELTRLVAFVGAGGLEKMRARERQEKKENEARAAEVHAELVAMDIEEK